MKTLVQIITFLLLILFFSSCGSTSTVTIGVTEPAAVYLSSDVHSIGIINRSLPSEKNKTIDDIDKILSIEGVNFDKEGAASAIIGLSDQLNRSNRFEKILNIEDIESIKKGLGVFPAELPWNLVDEICSENEIDILFSLEFYDTDTQVSYDVFMKSIPNVFGIEAKVPYHRVTLRTLIKSGWRIYDPKSNIVLDEFLIVEPVISTGEGINPAKAIEAVIGRKEAVLQLSNFIGSDYGMRLFPNKKRVRRSYYVRGTDNFKIAERRALTGNWDGAASLWEMELDNKNRKVAGRASYNMAIINEIDGNLEKAVEWASKAYSEYNDRNALNYVNILKSRMQEQAELDYQLNNQ